MSLECGVKSKMERFLVNLNVTDHIIDLVTEEKMLLNRVVQQYVNTISVQYNCTAAFNIQFAAIF